MKLEAVLRAAQILRAQPSYTMPLAKLHARLAEELGGAAGTYAQIYLQLKKRPESFMLIDTPCLLDTAHVWPAALRDDYDDALGGAGLGSVVRVALTEVADAEAEPGVLGLAAATVANLRRAGEADPVLREYFERAALELEEISSTLTAGAQAERPTTPLRDLPQ